MTSARQVSDTLEDLFEVNDVLGRIKDSGETGGPITTELLGRVLMHANTALEEVPNEKDGAIVEAVGLYLDTRAGQQTINMPSSLLGELVQICSVVPSNPIELQKL